MRAVEHPVKDIGLPPVPKTNAFCEPVYQVLFIENGSPSEAAEEIARQVLVYYGKEDESEAVAVRIDLAEVVLRPFVDAVLVKHGIAPDPNASRHRHKKGYRETVITQIQGAELELAPHSEAAYEPNAQTLLIENGDSSNACREMAKDIHILYDKDVNEAPTSAVAIRIDRAETVLKPFVDAILAKYGLKPEEDTRDMDTKAADD